jgi:hypothetical protein
MSSSRCATTGKRNVRTCKLAIGHTTRDNGAGGAQWIARTDFNATLGRNLGHSSFCSMRGLVKSPLDQTSSPYESGPRLQDRGDHFVRVFGHKCGLNVISQDAAPGAGCTARAPIAPDGHAGRLSVKIAGDPQVYGRHTSLQATYTPMWHSGPPLCPAEGGWATTDFSRAHPLRAAGLQSAFLVLTRYGRLEALVFAIRRRWDYLVRLPVRPTAPGGARSHETGS